MIFISGGVRSGKSRFAESLAIKKRTDRLFYVATSQPYDDEMKERVRYHKMDRLHSGAPWQTIEQSINMNAIVSYFKNGDVILLDCLPTWLSNELFNGYETGQEKWLDPSFRQNVLQNMKESLDSINQTGATVIIVSNEIFSNAESLENGALLYMYALAKLNQWCVAHAKSAYLVQCGIPCLKKGVLSHEGDNDSRNSL